jgi:phospholipase A1
MKNAHAFPRLTLVRVSFIFLLLGAVFTSGSSRAEEEGAGAETAKEAPSYLSRLWGLDNACRNQTFPITPYRSNYILPFTYDTSPNHGFAQTTDPGNEIKNEEVKFQISFKILLWQDVLGKEVDLWVAYTQLSFWQLYDFGNSSPFRTTDYEPEILLNFRTDYKLLGLRGRYISVGYDHQSNGEAGTLSRSWNRAVANFGFERGDFTFVLNTWVRVFGAPDNPDISKYMGYGQANLYYIRRGHRVGLFLRNNLRSGGNKGAVQLEWSFPLLRWVGGYVQYFNGYGESLLDYNSSSNRIGAGFILRDW